MKRVANDVKLGEGVHLYDFVNLYGCEIGDHTRVGTFVEIQKNARIGRNCKIQSHTFICEAVTIEDVTSELKLPSLGLSMPIAEIYRGTPATRAPARRASRSK